jgi:ethanolamine transporter EutH
MKIKGASIIFLVYLAVGIFIAWTHHYLTVAFLKALLSVVLVILLWWLVLLGVNLHIH